MKNKVSKISLRELSGKNINFLIGSGMSAPFLPTLWVQEEEKSLEDIFSQLEEENKEETIEYYYWQEYYWRTILKQGYLDTSGLSGEKSEEFKSVMRGYKKFLKSIINFLNMQNEDYPMAMNIFTTNYDLFFENAADLLFKSLPGSFLLNDGSSGFINRTYNVSNYDKVSYKTGVFGRKYKMIPTINLYKIHGSLSWKQENNIINVLYNKPDQTMLTVTRNAENKYNVGQEIYNSRKNVKNINNIDLLRSKELYDTLQIVSPTKKKFKDTLLNENYFHQIRSFTYELEKSNSVLITFGFSFEDEHVREIVKRCIANINLQVFIFVFSEDEFNQKFTNCNEKKFLCEAANVKFILPEDNGHQTLEIFNKKIFTSSEA